VEHQVLLYCTLYPGLRSIIILDNALIYKSARLYELCDCSGVVLEFLPLYLPDFNLIEAMFKDLKAWIKRNYILAAEFKSFDSFLEFAIS